MAKENKTELDKKIKDLKIELLKQPQKRKGIRKEIARALTSLKNLGNEPKLANKGGKK